MTHTRTTPLPDRLPLLGLDGIVLRHGSHGDRADGVCALEAAAWLAGEPHSDAPSCVCPVIRSFVMGWNDGLTDDETRTRLLKPFLPQILNTTSTSAVEITRSYLAFDWLVRVQTPAWLDLTPTLAAHAIALRGLTAISNQATIDAAMPAITAAWDAAWAAARAAARDAAGDAARDAAWAAARAAARDAAWAAARAAARAAAITALAPTVESLQVSAADLLTRMIAVRA